MQSKKFHYDLTEGNILKQLLRFSIPFLLANLLQALYNVVDMIVVGHFCGAVGISAVSISGQVTLLVTNIVAGFAVGGTVLISQYLGAKRHKDMNESIGTMLSVFAIAAVFITVVMLILVKPVLNLLNTPQEAFIDAQNYLAICMGGTIFIFGYNSISAILRGMGDSKRPLVFVAIASVINILLDLLFVGPLNMGAAGAAWATIIAQAVSFIISVIYLYHNNFVFDFKLKSFKLYKDKVRLLLKIGLPSSVQVSIVNLSFLTLTGIANSLGVIPSAVLGIGAKVNSFGILPCIAMSLAISSMVGQNIGAKEYDRAKQTTLTGMLFSYLFSIVLVAIINIFPEAIMGAFTSDAQTIEMGITYQRILSLDLLVVPVIFSIQGLSNGSGHTNFTLFNSMLSSLIMRAPLAYLFAITFGWRLNGIAIAVSAAPVSSVLLMVWFMQSGRWKKTRIHVTHYGEEGEIIASAPEESEQQS